MEKHKTQQIYYIFYFIIQMVKTLLFSIVKTLYNNLYLKNFSLESAPVK